MGKEAAPDWGQELATLHPFCLLPPQTLDVLFARLEECTFPAGAHLIVQGEDGDCLFVVLQGEVEVWVQGPGGKPTRVASFCRGDIVGEMALLTSHPRTATVTAKTPVTALRLPAEGFHDLACRHPEVSVVLTELVADRLGEGTSDGLRGKRVDRYRIHGTIARGGMGVVYEAADEEESGQPVALKMMSHRLLYKSGAAQRFQREAHVLMELDHPNVAHVLREFQAYRTYFIAMELIRGTDLRRLIEAAAPMPEAQIRRIVGQISDALLYLSERNVIHRDLKPDNILVTSDGVLKLVDFGLAKPIGWSLDVTSAEEIAVLGTPLYMAPEQLMQQTMSPAVDLYALGCVMYELITGKRLFTSSSFAELLLAKSQLSVPPRAELRPELDGDLYQFLVDCLASEPLQRNPDLARAASWAGPIDVRSSTRL